MSRIIKISLLIILFFSTKNFASNFYSLEDKWMIYDDAVSGFVPYVPEQHPFTKNFYMLLHVEDLSGLGIEILLPDGAAVFINNQLQDVAKGKNNKIFFNNDELLDRVKKSGEVLIVVNTVQGDHPTAYLADKPYSYRTITKKTQEENFNEGLIVRHDSSYRSMLLMWSIIVFVLVGVFSRIGGLKTGTDNILKSFEGVTLGRSDDTKMNTLQLIMFLFSFALVGSLSMMLFGKGDIWLSEVNSPELNRNMSEFFINVFYVILAIFAFVAFRLFVIYFLGNIFSNSQVSSVHSLEFYKLTWVYVLFYLFLCVLWTLNPFYISWDFMRNFIGIAFFLKSFLVYIAVSKQVNLRFNYLFSYFCATEFLPSLLAVKVFIG
ncbi:DUF4271 domain-containing protein [Flammeovirga agarivorans]|uniref:DUF4271 domain-containing protein n=1 Tax=Flammeovirga agarivorans TaxID=2726742 RepID=A0A7X8XZ17_9BACT|nr:DUF4271 domain-containing protein [Flammeovirga agarivorans]NLR94741.1 DUF4271 domain-containing protein [Flammeovirga agarivorans]